MYKMWEECDEYDVVEFVCSDVKRTQILYHASQFKLCCSAGHPRFPLPSCPVGAQKKGVIKTFNDYYQLVSPN